MEGTVHFDWLFAVDSWKKLWVFEVCCQATYWICWSIIYYNYYHTCLYEWVKSMWLILGNAKKWCYLSNVFSYFRLIWSLRSCIFFLFGRHYSSCSDKLIHSRRIVCLFLWVFNFVLKRTVVEYFSSISYTKIASSW